MNNARCIILFLLISCYVKLVSAQNPFLKQTRKLELTAHPGGIASGDATSKFEIKLENGQWISNRVNEPIVKRLNNQISPQVISDLVKIIKEKDTSIHLELFNINEEDLSIAFDKLTSNSEMKYAEISASQKATLLNMLTNKRLQEQILRKVLQPWPMDDKAHYTIKIYTNDGKEQLIEAYSFGNIYNLPWVIDGKEIFNPEISKIFAALAAEKRFDEGFNSYLHSRIVSEVFYTKFRTRFTLENLKKNYPVAYLNLGSTLQPIEAHKTKHGWGVTFKSSALPKKLTILGAFRAPDTILIAIKEFERRLVRLYHKKNYFFNYLKKNQTYSAKAVVTENTTDEDTDARIFNIVKAQYAPISTLTFKQVNILELIKLNDLGREQADAKWMLLPDDSLICIPYALNSQLGKTVVVYDKKGQLLQKLTGIDF